VPWHPTEIQYYAAFRDGHVVECIIRSLT
jgi:hypothetical protein